MPLPPVLGAASSSGAPTLTQQLASLGYTDFDQAAPDPAPSGILGNVFETIKNVPGDIGEFAGGLTSLVGGLAHDVLVNVPAEGLDALGLTPNNRNRDYFADDLAKTLLFDPELAGRNGLLAGISPGIQQYAEEAYGINPLKADLLPDISKVGRSIRENPLSTLLDVYQGGAAAAAGLQKAGAIPKTAASTTRLIGQGRHLEAFEKSLHVNPVRRATQKGWERLITHPTERVGSQVKELAAQFPDNLDDIADASERQYFNALSPELQNQVATYKMAKQMGLDRVPHAAVRTRVLQRGVEKWLSAVGANFYRHRNQDVYTAVLRHFEDMTDPRKGRRLTDLDLERRFHKTAEGVTRVRTPHVRPVFRDVSRTDEWIPESMRLADELHSQGAIPDEMLAEARDRFGYLGEHKVKTADDIRQIQQEIAELETGLAGGGGLAVDSQVGRRLEDLREIELDLFDELDSVDEFGRMLSERLAVQELGERADPMAELMSKLRWDKFDLLREHIEQGTMDGFRTEIRSTYGPRFVEEHAARQKAGQRTTYPEAEGGFPAEFNRPFVDSTQQINELFETGGRAFWRDMRDDVAQNGWASPLYFPQSDAARFGGEHLLKRSRPGATKKGYLNQRSYHNYINDRYLTSDPAEAYARRISNMRLVVDTHKFVANTIKRYGRVLQHADDFDPEAEGIYRVNAGKVHFRNRAQMDDAIGRARQAGMDPDQAAIAALKEIEDSISPQEVADFLAGQAKGEVYAVPRVVLDKLNSYTNYQFGKWMRIGWDTPANLWRSSVLSLSPRWVLNNLLGNITFAKMQGASLRDVAASMLNEKAAEWASKGRRPVLSALFGNKRGAEIDDLLRRLPEDQQASIDSGLVSSLQTDHTHLGAAANTVPGAVMEAVGGHKVVKRLRKYPQRVQAANNFIERHFRRASFVKGAERATQQTSRRFFTSLKELEDLAGGGLDTATIGRAIDEMNYFFNDYRAMSSFERNVIRRLAMPFWSFYKHVGKLALTYPVQHPLRAGALRMMGEMAEEIEPDLGLVPSWMEHVIPAGEGADDKSRFWNFSAANPLSLIEEVADDPRQILGALHPGLTFPIEYAIGEDLATGIPFTSPNVGKTMTGDQFEVIRDAQGNIVGVGEEPAAVRPSVLENFLPPVKTALDVLAGQKRYSTGESMPDSDRSRLQPFGQFLGLSTFDYDVEGYREFLAQQRMMALIDALRAEGVLPEPEEEVL